MERKFKYGQLLRYGDLDIRGTVYGIRRTPVISPYFFIWDLSGEKYDGPAQSFEPVLPESALDFSALVAVFARDIEPWLPTGFGDLVEEKEEIGRFICEQPEMPLRTDGLVHQLVDVTEIGNAVQHRLCRQHFGELPGSFPANQVMELKQLICRSLIDMELGEDVPGDVVVSGLLTSGSQRGFYVIGRTEGRKCFIPSEDGVGIVEEKGAPLWRG